MSNPEADRLNARKNKGIWFNIKRFLPFIIIALAFVIVRVSGIADYLSFEEMANGRADLIALRDELSLWGPLLLIAIYALLAAVAMPGMAIVTIAAGFLFGTWVGGISVLIGATFGATLLFLATRTALRPLLAQKAGPWLTKVNEEVARGEISYMLTIRLLPVIPFWIANLAPGFVQIRLRTFIWTSFFGMAPGTFVYASLGSGVGSIMDKGEVPQLSGLMLQPNILLPLIGLIALSLMPVIYRHVRRKKG